MQDIEVVFVPVAQTIFVNRQGQRVKVVSYELVQATEEALRARSENERLLPLLSKLRESFKLYKR